MTSPRKLSSDDSKSTSSDLSRKLTSNTFFHVLNIVFDPFESYNLTLQAMLIAKPKFENNSFLQSDADFCSLIFQIENIRMDVCQLNAKLEYDWEKWGKISQTQEDGTVKEIDPANQKQIIENAIPRIHLFKELEVIINAELIAYQLGKNPANCCKTILKKLAELKIQAEKINVGSTLQETFTKVIFLREDLGVRYYSDKEPDESTSIIFFQLSLEPCVRPYNTIDEELAELMHQSKLSPPKNATPTKNDSLPSEDNSILQSQEFSPKPEELTSGQGINLMSKV